MTKLLIPLLFLLVGEWTAPVHPAVAAAGETIQPAAGNADNLVERVTVAINYRHRGGATKINFRGTPLMPLADGEAKVESRRGYIEINAEFRKLKPAISLGAEYLTYVLWAITPEGRAANLGEILINKGKSKLRVTTELQVFGLVVTAEPYFAVRRPSDLVVLENEVRPETKGKVQVVDAKYELLKRGGYKPLSNPLSLTVDPKVPLELYEARNAVQIAKSSGADRYAEDTFLKAEQSLRQAIAYQARDPGAKPVTMLAREAVQRAEDAREIGARRQQQERLARERAEAARREQVANAAAAEQARLRAAAEKQHREREQATRRAREQAKREVAARKQLEAELAKARETARKAEQEARRAMALLKERTASFGDQRTQWEQTRTQREQDDLDRARRLVQLKKAERRVRLYSQLSRLLFTRDTDAGLALEVPVELFEPHEAALTAAGREKLAVITGILLANPGLVFAVPPEPTKPGKALPEPDINSRRSELVRRFFIDHGLRQTAPSSARPVGKKLPADAAGTGDAPAELPVMVLIFGAPIDDSEPAATPQARQ